jgi:hypothetical protein
VSKDRVVSAILFDHERVDRLDDLPGGLERLNGSKLLLGRHRPAQR